MHYINLHLQANDNCGMSEKHQVLYKYSFVDVAVTEAYAILLIPKQIWESVANLGGGDKYHQICKNRIWINFKANFTNKHIWFPFVSSSAVLWFPTKVIIGLGCEGVTKQEYLSIKLILAD